MRDRNAHENEVKLLGGYNNQLKYSDCSVKDTMKKISMLLGVFEIKQEGVMEKKKHSDIYYDTFDNKIKKRNGSARIRVAQKGGEKKTLITLKTKVDEYKGVVTAWQDALIRNERECEVENITKGEQVLKDYAISVYGLGETERLEKRIEVKNERNYCIITTKIGSYELSYDKFKYTNPLDNSESPYYYEIEIEQTKKEGEDPQYDFDPQIAQFVKILKEVMGFQYDGKNKYERGIEWKKRKDKTYSKNFIVFDIVGYSKEYTSEQKKKVEKFTDIVKKCLTVLSDTEIIPIGDGLILIVPEEQNVFRFINKIFHLLNTVNENREESERIYIRTSIHNGKVMKYIDINENRNYAGEGINIAYRINSGAEPGQILVSEAFHHMLMEKGHLEEGNYERAGTLIVKHGVQISVYNYYDENLVVGKRPN